MRKRRVSWAVLLCIGASAAPLAAQQCRGGDPGAVVRGIVLDSATRVPLQGAEVRLNWTAADGAEHKFKLDSDSAGRFRLCRLPTDRPLSLEAEFTRSGPVRQLRLAPHDSAEVQLDAPAAASELRGRVLRAEDGAPLSSADVQVLGTPLRATSDARGWFEIPRLPPGRYRVRIEQLGYGTRTDTIDVDYRSAVELRAVLAPAPVKLPPLTVDVRSHALEDAGFYARREHGPGTFLTRPQWERRQLSKASEILRTVPGIRLQLARSGFDNVVLDRRGCPVRYVLDGIRTNPTFQLDEIHPDAIQALEVYRGPSEVPAQFAAFSSSERSTCGVIVIWTRTR